MLRTLPLAYHFSSVQSLSRVPLFATPWIAARQASLSITISQSSDSCPSSPWCHPAISSLVGPFSSCPQSLPASQSFPMSQVFTWGGQSTGVSASASFLPMNIQGWFLWIDRSNFPNWRPPSRPKDKVNKDTCPSTRTILSQDGLFVQNLHLCHFPRLLKY